MTTHEVLRLCLWPFQVLCVVTLVNTLFCYSSSSELVERMYIYCHLLSVVAPWLGWEVLRFYLYGKWSEYQYQLQPTSIFQKKKVRVMLTNFFFTVLNCG